MNKVISTQRFLTVMNEVMFTQKFQARISQIENVLGTKTNQLCMVHGIHLGCWHGAWISNTVHMKETERNDMNTTLECNLLVLVIPLDDIRRLHGGAKLVMIFF